VPFPEALAVARRQALPVEAQLLVEPRAAGDEAALGVLALTRFLELRIEAGERRLELGLRIGLAAGRVEEVRVVDEAVNPRRSEIGNVVQELVPLRPLGEPKVAGLRNQLLEVRLGRGRGRRGDQGCQYKKPERNGVRPCFGLFL